MSDNVIHVGDADFETQVLNSEQPVLVDFWAEWCGPCKMIGPIIDELADTYAGRVKVAKLNVDANRQTAAKFGIRGIPALLVFKNGQIQASQVGAVGKAQLAQLIESAI
ncbi:MAG: thioredoxin TrxA [Lysobacteraceae bacterium]|uniref:thioredoxin TrxA n=1 Tax=Denitratimonas sp. CY0512 TaxID=3131940 RepID=UPI0030A5F931